MGRPLLEKEKILKAFFLLLVLNKSMPSDKLKTLIIYFIKKYYDSKQTTNAV